MRREKGWGRIRPTGRQKVLGWYRDLECMIVKNPAGLEFQPTPWKPQLKLLASVAVMTFLRKSSYT
jgi:hypothetical protein